MTYYIHQSLKDNNGVQKMSSLEAMNSQERREKYIDLFEQSTLQSYEGTFENTSLTQLLFLLSFSKYNATIFCEQIPNKSSVQLTIKKGKVIDVVGIPGLLSNKIGTTTATSLSELVEIAMGRGLDFESIYQELSKDIGTYLVLLSNQSHGNIRVVDMIKPVVSLKIPNSISSMIFLGIQQLYDTTALQKELTPIMRHRVRCKEINIESLMLNPQSLQIWKQSQGGGYVQDILGSLVQVNENWSVLVYFLSLGLIQTKQRRHERSPKEKSNEKQDIQDKQKTPEPTSQVYLEMKEYFTSIQNLEVHQVLSLEKPGDVNVSIISERVGSLSAKYHPDRYVSDGEETQKLAEKIFQLIQDASMILEDETFKQDLKLRLDAESRGLQYVSEADANKADMIYTQGKILFRKQNFEQAGELLEKAFQLNPYNWRICHMKINCQLKLKQIEKQAAAHQILELQPEQGHEKLELRFQACELLIQFGTKESKRQGYELLDKVLEVDPEHQGAKRLQRLREKERNSKNESKQSEEVVEKTETTETPQKRGFFSSLFGRK